MNRFPLAMGLTFSLLALHLGCTRSDLPPIGKVSGMVTLDGEPLGGADIEFVPTEGGRTSIGTTDGGGRYELIYSPDAIGARTGTHKVSITVEGGPSIPPRYNRDTELTAEVMKGRNDISFDLQSQ